MLVGLTRNIPFGSPSLISKSTIPFSPSSGSRIETIAYITPYGRISTCYDDNENDDIVKFPFMSFKKEEKQNDIWFDKD